MSHHPQVTDLPTSCAKEASRLVDCLAHDLIHEGLPVSTKLVALRLAWIREQKQREKRQKPELQEKGVIPWSPIPLAPVVQVQRLIEQVAERVSLLLSQSSASTQTPTPTLMGFFAALEPAQPVPEGHGKIPCRHVRIVAEDFTPNGVTSKAYMGVVLHRVPSAQDPEIHETLQWRELAQLAHSRYEFELDALEQAEQHESFHHGKRETRSCFSAWYDAAMNWDPNESTSAVDPCEESLGGGDDLVSLKLRQLARSGSWIPRITLPPKDTTSSSVSKKRATASDTAIVVLEESDEASPDRQVRRPFRGRTAMNRSANGQEPDTPIQYTASGTIVLD